jgi:hypothetical protein
MEQTMPENAGEDPNVLDAELVEDASNLPAVVSPDLPPPDYSDTGVPSFDFVRDRIENRFHTSVGATELAGLGTDQDMASLDKKIADRDAAARDKLAEIRKSMRGE